MEKFVIPGATRLSSNTHISTIMYVPEMSHLGCGLERMKGIVFVSDCVVGYLLQVQVDVMMFALTTF